MADASFEPLSGSGYEPGGTPALEPIAGSAFEPGGAPSFELLTGSGAGENWDAQGAGSLEALIGAAGAPGNFVSTGTGVFERLTAAGTTPDAGAASFELLQLSAQSDSGRAASGSPVLLALTASAEGTGVNDSAGSSSFQYLLAAVRAQNAGDAVGAASIRLLQAAAAGAGGTLGAGAGAFQVIAASAAGYPEATASGSPQLERLRAYSSAEAQLADARDTWAMNTRTNAVTSYPSFPANSLARYNGTYLGAGPTGLYVLEGDSDIEAGTTWKVRTGQLDDKKVALKRLTEILLSGRTSGTVRVRVYKDDSTYYDYVLPNRSPDELQQVRVKTGKGLRSRYFMVELSGTGTRFELDSVLGSTVETARRIG